MVNSEDNLVHHRPFLRENSIFISELSNSFKKESLSLKLVVNLSFLFVDVLLSFLYTILKKAPKHFLIAFKRFENLGPLIQHISLPALNHVPSHYPYSIRRSLYFLYSCVLLLRLPNPHLLATYELHYDKCP